MSLTTLLSKEGPPNGDCSIPFPPKPSISATVTTQTGAESAKLLVLTHGAGGTHKSAALTHLAAGASHNLTTVCWTGSPSLPSRTKQCTAVALAASPGGREVVLGGRSMGARAATAVHSAPLKEINLSRRLVLHSYPLVAATGKPDPKREDSLLALGADAEVLFVSGSEDALCPLDQLAAARKRMQARSWLITVEGADHGLDLRVGSGGEVGKGEVIRLVGERVGELVGQWCTQDLPSENAGNVRWDREHNEVNWSGWRETLPSGVAKAKSDTTNNVTDMGATMRQPAESKKSSGPVGKKRKQSSEQKDLDQEPPTTRSESKRTRRKQAPQRDEQGQETDKQRPTLRRSKRKLLPYVLEPLPLGSIKPKGWLRDQMQLMADGLAGHESDFYRYVKQSSWLGGDQEYSGLNEGFPYWFNGLVPLAYGLDNDRLKSQVKSAVSYIIEHQQSDGWIGPETGTARNFWARYPVFLGLMNLVHADAATFEESVVPAMHRFVDLMNSMLQNNYTGYIYHEGDELDEVSWGRVRVQDMMVSLQWLYERHPRNNSQLLLENMWYLYNGSLDWAYWFQEGVYIKDDLYNVPVNDTLYPYEHGVNAGQGLKAGAVIRRFTHNDALLETTRNGVNWTFLYHGAASGTIIADERLVGLSPYSGSELCTAVETMYSLSYLYQTLGDASFADRCELAAFNALPVMLTPDCKELSETPFYNTNAWGQTFGLEPSYPCCTVNHPQGFPKFSAATFAKIGNNGVAHALLSPATASTILNGTGGAVKLDCRTDYPFGNVLYYNISADGAFDFHVRVPSWYKPSGSSISISGGSSASLSPDPHTGLHKIRLNGSGTLEYRLGSDIILEQRANETVAVRHGALLYALEIGSANTSTLPKNYANKTYYPENYAPAQARDYTILNTSAWNVAIDPCTLALADRNVDRSELSNPISAPGAPPTSITALGCLIDWPLFRGSVPGAPPTRENKTCLGDAFPVRLVPYGSAKLHMAELPTIDLGNG
ncbi:hypothetical protein LTR66_002607 [Elasticomyces elasticus]|nr:hypothetical protein LTR66_002607 [Elasticomyces elasticus]